MPDDKLRLTEMKYFLCCSKARPRIQFFSFPIQCSSKKGVADIIISNL